MKKTIILLAAVMTAVIVHGQQVEVSCGTLTNSKFQDSDHNDYGKGSMQQYNIRYNQPLSMRMSEDGRPIAWTASLSSTLSVLDNHGQAEQYNPDNVLNTSLTFSHIRPISKRWSIIASLGAGVYSATDDIRWSSVLFNGACIFVYQATDYLSFGGGVGLTNAYGAPMVVPMAYMHWGRGKKTSINLTLTNGIKAVAAHNFNRQFTLTWNILDMNALTSIVSAEDKRKIYSSMMLRSYFQPTLRLTGKHSIYLSAGVNIVRTRKLTNRSIKNMFKMLDSDDRRHFAPAAYLAVGYRYGF